MTEICYIGTEGGLSCFQFSKLFINFSKAFVNTQFHIFYCIRKVLMVFADVGELSVDLIKLNVHCLG